ncbi:MAG: carbohydrate kinase, partial [bacterium]
MEETNNIEAPAVVCIGELLVDFMAQESAPDAGRADRFIKSPGGAVANVAFALARLGNNARFVGKTGSDPFGAYLKEVLEKEGVDLRWLLVSDDYPTGLVFVVLDERKVPKYCFFGDPSADMMLESGEIGAEVLDEAAFLHAGTVSMVRDPACSATFELMERARKAGVKVSFDPNLRLHLWKDHERLRRITTDALRLAVLAKLSQDDLEFVTGEREPEKGAARIVGLG